MWKAIWVVLCSFFSLNVFYGQAFINLFYSSSPLFQFPGKKPLVGRNVRAISVSVPFFPCVNALPSKSTASLCIYCVRRWVLSFFSPFHGWNLSAFLRAESDMVMDCWCATSERLNERTHWERERTWTQVCDAEKRRDDCEKNLCERVWTEAASVFSVGPSEGHSFTFFRPSCSVYLPPFSDIAIIFKELHLKKKKKDICSGMFKWSTKYLCSCLIWCECCVWCVFYLAVTELICVNVMWCCLWAGLWEWAVNEGERELWVA